MARDTGKNKALAETSVDVLVAGGGPGGAAAAIAAARLGAKTLVVERYGFFGGMMTAGLVNPFMTYSNGESVIIEGVFGALLRELEERGGLDAGRHAFDEEVAKLALDEMVRAPGAEVLFHSWVADAEVRDGRIARAFVETKEGRLAVTAGQFVDATGDGDLAERAGAEVEFGRPEDGLAQPMTTCFRMAGVDLDRVPERPEINALYAEARADGSVRNPRHNVLFFHYPRPGIVHFNTTRIIKLDATKSADLTAAEFEGRRQVREMAAFLVERVPGFENAYLEKIATQVGVRETRRVMGDYVLTVDDVLGARKFADGIARGSYCVDIHNPAGEGTVIKRLEKGTSYEIPARSLTARGLANLVVGCRAISATHEAHSSLRVMPIVMAVGEAAGTAAALAAAKGVAPRELAADELRGALAENGANLDREPGTGPKPADDGRLAEVRP
jgi:glycine/D-amino acid oxidase-like deaminating enzyme